MKKGVLNIAVLVLVLINLVLSLILTFSIVPTMNNSNKLVQKIASIVDLELDKEGGEKDKVVSVDQKEVHKIEEKLTNKLAEGSDGKTHYATGYAAIYINKEHEDYDAFTAVMADQETTISSHIKKVMATYTMEEFDEDVSAVEDAILTDLQEYFGSTCICEVALDMVAS